MAYIAHVVTQVWCGEVVIYNARLCTVCVWQVAYRFVRAPVQSLTLSQSAKDIHQYFKFQIYVEDPGHRKPVLILPNGLNKPGERAHDRNLISAVVGIGTHNLLIDSPACHY